MKGNFHGMAAGLLVAGLVASSSAWAADEVAAVADQYEMAVLACHADYVKAHVAPRLELGLADFGGFTASEIAHAAAAACHAPMLAYEQHVRAQAPITGWPQGHVRAEVAELRQYAFDYTLDLMVRARG